VRLRPRPRSQLRDRGDAARSDRARNGILVNVTELRDTIRRLILDDVDHRHLNHDSKLCRGINPTVENLTVLFFNVLRAHYGELLYEVCLHETEKNWARYRGE
jgi:6-pyruvoyltetrahydropterin/6-carboxytetrahydropterin synthase